MEKMVKNVIGKFKNYFNPFLKVYTPYGKGYALLVIDCGQHKEKYWIVALKNSASIKFLSSKNVAPSKKYAQEGLMI